MVYKMSLRKVPKSGPPIQKRALLFAKGLENEEFKVSNGWLESFYRRHNITLVTRSRDCGDILKDVVKKWKEKLGRSLCES